MSRYRSGPSPLLIILVGALLVFGGYYVWLGFLDFLEDRGDITAEVTRQVVASATAQAAPPALLPTLYMPPTFTALPPCQWFRVSAERAVYRECPSTNNQECPVREVVPAGTELCVYARAQGNAEWYVVDLNPDGAYRDTVFIHESVVEAVNPTPTITRTPSPLPTITPTPSNTPAPTQPVSPTPTPSPTAPVSPVPASPTAPEAPSGTPPITPAATPSAVPTLPQVSI